MVKIYVRHGKVDLYIICSGIICAHFILLMNLLFIIRSIMSMKQPVDIFEPHRPCQTERNKESTSLSVITDKSSWFASDSVFHCQTNRPPQNFISAT